MQSSYTVTLEALVIFFCALILFTIGLSHQEIIGFESRFYVFALEMVQHGMSWFPTTYLQPYPDYPVTPTIFIYLASKIGGSLNKLTAVLPSAIAAAGTVSFTFLIGALHERRWGLSAVFFMLLTYTFLMEARTISPDQYVTFATVCCFYLVYSAERLQQPARVYWMPLVLFFGFACRGPIGLVIPAGVVCVFYGLDTQFKKMIVWGVISLSVLALGCVLLCLIAYHVGGFPFVLNVWHMQVAGRLQDAYLPWYFYFSDSIGSYALTYPLAIAVVVGLFRSFIKNTSTQVELMQKLVGWLVIILIGLSIPAGKKPRYVLAMVPALSLICGYLVMIQTQENYLGYLRKLVYLVCFLFPAVSLFCLIAGYYLGPRTHWLAQIDFLNVGIIFFILQCISYWVWKKFPTQHFLILGVAACVFVVFYMGVIEPVNLVTNKTHDFVNEIEKMRHLEKAQLIFYQENPDGLPIKYLANTTRDDEPVFIDSPNQLTNYNKKAVVVVTKENFLHIPIGIVKTFKVVQSGNIGHAQVYVLEKMN